MASTDPEEGRFSDGRWFQGCCGLVLAVPLFVFAGAWMIAEHPDKNGHIVASDESRFSFPMMIAGGVIVLWAFRFFKSR